MSACGDVTVRGWDGNTKDKHKQPLISPFTASHEEEVQRYMSVNVLYITEKVVWSN